MSDWGAVHSTLETATYGLDLEMPNGEFVGKEKLLPLIKERKVKESTIDDKVKRILRVMFRMGYFDKELDKPEANASKQRAVALDVARGGIVLLKNDDNMLPLNSEKAKTIAVIGPNADELRTGGGGSSRVDPAFSQSPLDGIRKAFNNSEISYIIGARLLGDVPPIDSQYFFLPNDTTGAHGVRAEYYDNMNLQGEPKLVRVDKNIGFNWENGKPAEGFGIDKFSVRWTGKLQLTVSGAYEITAATDDGVRLYIDGKLVIDNWGDHALEAKTVKMNLEAEKQYDIKFEYYEDGGAAIAILGWNKPSDSESNVAVEIAKKSEIALLFLGDSQFQESEGFDRDDISLRQNQIDLINTVAVVNPDIIVV